MAVLLKNNAVSKLAGSIDTTQTTLSVNAGEGARFPAPTGGDWFPITLEAISGGTVTREIVRCTARSGDTLTVVRAQEGTSGQAFTSGDRVELRYTAAVHDALKARIKGNEDTLADPATGLDQRLLKSQNLADLANKATARANLSVVERTSLTGAAALPAGTEAQRDVSPQAGYIRFNSDIGLFEGYNGTVWVPVGAGATGSAGDQVFVENDQVVSADYTIPADKNASSTGPITINAGVTVTISAGARWLIH